MNDAREHIKGPCHQQACSNEIHWAGTLVVELQYIISITDKLIWKLPTLKIVKAIDA